MRTRLLLLQPPRRTARGAQGLWERELRQAGPQRERSVRTTSSQAICMGLARSGRRSRDGHGHQTVAGAVTPQ